MIDEEPLLPPRAAAALLALSLAALWRGVRNETLPQPVYPSPRSPRWLRTELLEAVKARRMAPSEAVAARRASRKANKP
jgi:predicted DNA-binding transcriptional regulator AlpA